MNWSLLSLFAGRSGKQTLSRRRYAELFEALEGRRLLSASHLVAAGSADVQVGIAPVGTPTEGQNESYSVVLANDGPDVAADVQLTIVVPPANARFVSFIDTSGHAVVIAPSSGGSGTITATLPTMAVSALEFFNLVLTPIEEGSLTFTANVSSATSDPVPSNNTATETDPVVDPPVSAHGVSSPVVNISPGNSTGTITLATFTDPGGAEPTSDYSATINWGDGSSGSGTISYSAGTFSVAGSHVYANAGVYSPKITIDHESSTPQTVTNANRVNVSGSTFPATGINFYPVEGRTFNGTVATFQNSNTSLPASNFSATINWGDGSSSTSGVISGSNGHYSITGSHTYAEQINNNHPYHVYIDISSNAGGSSSAVSAAYVSDAPLDMPAGDSEQATQGVAYTNLLLGSFRDQDAVNRSAGDYHGTIDWGDGTTSSATFQFNYATPNVGSYWNVYGSHTYSTSSTFAVTITISDDPNNIVKITTSITVGAGKGD